MVDFKLEIANKISNAIDISKMEILELIEVPKDKANGDYAFPCFKLAKNLKKAPQIIASEIKEKIELNSEYITKIEDVRRIFKFG